MPSPLLQYLHQFGTVPTNDEEVITTSWENRLYKEGEYLFKEGKTCNEIFFVVNGIVRITSVNESGNEITLFFIKENHLCTILYSFENGTTSSESIVAACNVTVLAISKKSLEKLYEKLPWLQERIQHITHKTLMEKIALRNLYFSQDDAASRYKLFLQYQADIVQQAPLSSIASYLGVTPQSLSRIRRAVR